RGIYAANSSGQIITIVGASGMAFTPSGDVAANNSGSFAVAGVDPNGGSLGIYGGSRNGGSIITISGSNFSRWTLLSAGRSGSSVAWGGTLSLGGGSSSSALYIADLDHGSVLTITGSGFGQCAVDSNGDVIVDETDPSTGQRSLMEYFEHGEPHRPYLSIGDS